jgi:hypothetical protein
MSEAMSGLGRQSCVKADGHNITDTHRPVIGL